MTMQCLAQLGNVEMSLKPSWSISRMRKKVQALEKEVRPTYKELIVEKFFDKDEKGELVPAKNDNGDVIHGQFQLKNPTKEGKEELENATKEFMAIENEIDLYLIPLSSLTDTNGQLVTLQPNILSELEPLFEDDL